MRNSTLLIHLSSDMHIEFDTAGVFDRPAFPASSDVMVFAGDMDVGDYALSFIRETAQRFPRSQILFVAGNHEFYRSEYHTVIQRYRAGLADVPNAHFLENGAVVIDGVLFLGCTLWTGFDAYPQIPPTQAMDEAERGVADFHLIRFGERRLRARDVRQRYRQSRRWLASQLARTDVPQKVVITHFPPCVEVSHGTIPENTLSPYFQANCRDLIDTHQPDLWLFGHNHWCHDLKLGRTRLVSNQTGYPGEFTNHYRLDHQVALEIHWGEGDDREGVDAPDAPDA